MPIRSRPGYRSEPAKTFKDVTLSYYIPYFGELLKYLCEKSFATDIIYIFPQHWVAEFYVGNISREFGQQIVEPWIAAWTQRHRPFDIKPPHVEYKEIENVMILTVPLASAETTKIGVRVERGEI